MRSPLRSTVSVRRHADALSDISPCLVETFREIRNRWPAIGTQRGREGNSVFGVAMPADGSLGNRGHAFHPPLGRVAIADRGKVKPQLAFKSRWTSIDYVGTEAVIPNRILAGGH